ncbi:hypothetical protein BaRGS_00034628 [Batillaria attramentaria]|uniref:Uncharacterized protein n=1 Tax=Batillaria attramentaria TaxID=370345 RepID=A0ABD0JGH6_9CAEN
MHQSKVSDALRRNDVRPRPPTAGSSSLPMTLSDTMICGMITAWTHRPTLAAEGEGRVLKAGPLLRHQVATRPRRSRLVTLVINTH